MKRFALNLFFVTALILTLGLSLLVGGVAWAIPNSQHVCQQVVASANNTSMVHVPIADDFFVNVHNGFIPRDCIVTLSMETVAGETTLRISYAIDGGSCSQQIGPEAIASDEDHAATHTAVVVIELGPGLHTIQPCFGSSDEGKVVRISDRCLIAECWTR